MTAEGVAHLELPRSFASDSRTYPCGMTSAPQHASLEDYLDDLPDDEREAALERLDAYLLLLLSIAQRETGEGEQDCLTAKES